MNYVHKILLPFIEKHNLLYKIITIVILVIIGYITYHNIFDNSFHFDDSVWRQLDQVINEDYIGLFDFNFFRVLPFSTFIYNYHVYGEDTSGYFYFNLSVHISNALLCFTLLLLIFKAPIIKDKQIAIYAPILAFLGALIFLTHPIQTQAVAYIYQRLASMAAFFYLSSCVLYLSFRLSENYYKKIIFLILLVFSFVLAIFTKENTFTLPITIVIFELVLFHKQIKIKPRQIVILVSIFVALVVLAQIGLGFDQMFKPQKSPYDDIISSENYFLTQFRVISTYWRLLILPYGQHLDHYFPLSESFFELWTILGFLFNLLVISIGFLTLKKHPIISLGIFWFYTTLLIESSVIPIRDVIFEHRLYLPIFGFVLIVLYIVFEFINKKYFEYILLLLIAITLLYSYLSYQRNRVWQNDGTLWTDTIRKSPLNSRAWNNRGLYFFKKEKYDVAIYNFSKSIELRPTYSEPYSNRGTAYFYIGQYMKSLQDMNKSIELNPKKPDLYMNRSNVHIILKDYKSAIKDIKFLQNSQPEEPHSYSALARCHRELGNWDEAIINYKKFLEFVPNNISAYINLSICYTIIDSLDQAISTYDRGINANPNSIELMIRKADLLLQTGKKQEAKQLLQKIRELEPDYPGLAQKLSEF